MEPRLLWSVGPSTWLVGRLVTQVGDSDVAGRWSRSTNQPASVLIPSRLPRLSRCRTALTGIHIVSHASSRVSNGAAVGWLVVHGRNHNRSWQIYRQRDEKVHRRNADRATQ